MKVRVNLRWSRGSSAFPFQYDVDVGTTVREVCMMVLETNNRWHGNPRFSVVKVISFGTRGAAQVGGAGAAQAEDRREEGENGEASGAAQAGGGAQAAEAGEADDRCVGDFAEDGECYFVFAAG